MPAQARGTMPPPGPERRGGRHDRQRGQAVVEYLLTLLAAGVAAVAGFFAAIGEGIGSLFERVLGVFR